MGYNFQKLSDRARGLAAAFHAGEIRDVESLALLCVIAGAEVHAYMHNDLSDHPCDRCGQYFRDACVHSVASGSIADACGDPTCADRVR